MLALSLHLVAQEGHAHRAILRDQVQSECQHPACCCGHVTLCVSYHVPGTKPSCHPCNMTITAPALVSGGMRLLHCRQLLPQLRCQRPATIRPARVPAGAALAAGPAADREGGAAAAVCSPSCKSMTKSGIIQKASGLVGTGGTRV
jgi:hypothetical protein